MPLDFMITGVLGILFLFFARINPFLKSLFALCVCCIQLSYFFGKITFETISFNWLCAIGLIAMTLLFFFVLNKVEKSKVLGAVALSCIVFITLIILNPYYLIQFSYWQNLIINAIVGGVLLGNTKTALGFCCLSALAGQTINALASLKIFNSFVFFDENFYKLFVYSFVVILAVLFVKNIALFRFKNRTCIVYCKEVENNEKN